MSMRIYRVADPVRRISLPMSPMAMKKRSKEAFGVNVVHYRLFFSFFLMAPEMQSLGFLNNLRHDLAYFINCSYFETLQLTSTKVLIQKIK
jgi:hypothetical protein